MENIDKITRKKIDTPLSTGYLTEDMAMMDPLLTSSSLTLKSTIKQLTNERAAFGAKSLEHDGIKQ